METVNYNCPTCGAANIQRISLAYLKGTGTTLSNLLSPPQKKTWMFRGLCALAFLVIAFTLIVTVATETAENTPPVWFMIVIAVIIGVWLGDRATRRLTFNKNVYPILLRNWNAEFICLRCSKRFFPSTLNDYAGGSLTIDVPSHNTSPLLAKAPLEGYTKQASTRAKMNTYQKIIFSLVGVALVVLLIAVISVTTDKDPQSPPSTVVTPALAAPKPINDENVNRQLTECLLPKAQYGEYSSYDGGKSAMRLLEDDCTDEYLAWEESCEKHGDTARSCVTKSMILAQSAIKQFGK